MYMKILLLSLLLLISKSGFSQEKQLFKFLKKTIGAQVLFKADSVLALQALTITASFCPRSAGGKHDFYSEGDYWWPNPIDPSGPYIQKDGQTNPDNFLDHRRAMVRFSQICGLMASAYRLKPNEKYAIHALKHMKAWFIDSATYMNPSLLYTQAIKGKATGRGIGIIDMIQMMEVAQAALIFKTSSSFSDQDFTAIKKWFSTYLLWLNSHPYGIDEREAKNNHGTCWLMQAAVFARLTEDYSLLAYCRERFKNVLIPTQLGANGGFPLELARTKPYAYSLFNLDAMSVLCHVLSLPSQNLWKFSTNKQANMRTAVRFMLPYVAEKNLWPYAHDLMYWDQWPVAHPFLLFSYREIRQKSHLKLWKRLDHFPNTEEVIRNLPVRNPLIWI
jgi:hypothetical protein